ncbi:twin-arginine translocation pathway signal [Caulobacter sp. Root656]|nr:twin-arginine translocation pathway signal [Caulobacter sp. Root656]
MSQLNRRDVLALGAAAAALGGQALAAAAPGDATAEALLAQVAEDLMREYPENASALGLDKDRRAALKSSLTDRSLAGRGRLAAAARARVARMKAVDRKGLSPAAALDLGVVQTAHELAVEGFDFAYGDAIGLSSQWSYRNAPYVVAQNTGAFVETPDFLDSQHAVASAADVESYLHRLELYAAQLDGETARLRHDGALGVIAPDFLLDKTLKQQKGARAQPVAEWGLVTSLARKGKDIPGDHARRAAAIVEGKVAPAMDRQIAELAAHRARATSDAGAWKLPDGEAYYAWALRAGTTSRLTPDEVHQMGEEQLKALFARMDTLLKAQGLTEGSVGTRMKALGEDPRNLFPNTDAGRTQILAYLNGRVADIRTRLPRAFATMVPGNLVIKRVPVEIQDGAPGGYAAAGSIDGTVPGNYYINLRDTGMWPRYGLPTLTYHEGLPGHIWQGEYTYKLPLVRSLLAFNAYSEGWALYAEQLADELGAYDGDPLGQLGYLQSIAFRACRLVVDTGIHARRWTRDQAIDWFVATNGSTRQEVQGEVDRYCAWPGQACGYKVGHSEIVRLRSKAKAALGPRFDLRTFDDAVVMGGNVPLTQLEGVIDAYVKGKRTA